MKKTKTIIGKVQMDVVGHQCDICQKMSIVEYIRIDKKKFTPEPDFNNTNLSICCLCGKDFCNTCWEKSENKWDTGCEDGVLCPECGKTHYMDDEHEGVAVCRRSDDKPVNARWL